MAHFEKYKRGDAQRVRREALRICDSKSEYFNKEKSNLNSYYENGMINEYLETHKPQKKDNVITINEILTRPKGLKDEDAERFYKDVAIWTKERLHSDKIHYIAIHRDEMTEHAHICFSAWRTDDNKYNAKKMLTKSFLLKYHKDLEKHILDNFGYLIEITKDNKEPHLTFEEYKEKMKAEDEEKEQGEEKILFDL